MKEIIFLNVFAAVVAAILVLLGSVGFIHVNYQEERMLKNHAELTLKLGEVKGGELANAVLQSEGTGAQIFSNVAKALAILCVALGMGILILNGDAVLRARRV